MIRAASHRALALFASILFASLSIAQTSLTHAVYGSPNQPSDIFVADLNGDGKPDIITTQSESNLVTVFLNHGNGTFTTQGSAHYLAGSTPFRVVAADINGDGKIDIVTAGGKCTTTDPAVINLLLGNGDGTFRAPLQTQLPTGECIESMGLTKVNSSKFDIAITSPLNFIRLLMNNGSAAFKLGPTVASPGTNVRGLSSADYDHDGHWDLAAISFAGGRQRVFIFKNDGAGHYTAQPAFDASPVESSPGAVDMIAVNTVDVNGDGSADLLVPFQSHDVNDPAQQAGLIIASNLGSPSFAITWNFVDPRFFAVGYKAAAGDFTGDGLRDVVLPVLADSTKGSTADAFALLRGTSTKTWAVQQYLSVGSSGGPTAVAAGAFNGRVGFAGSTQFSDSMHVYNSTIPACAAPTSAGVKICIPAANATMGSPVAISAAANGGTRSITTMRAYIDGKVVAGSTSGKLTASVKAAVGTHTLNVNAWNSAGTLFKSTTRFTVR